MTDFYGSKQRDLQDRFDTRRLADRVEQIIVHGEISAEYKLFIETRDMFFLSTIDHKGRPSCSYKGGDPGFVRVAIAEIFVHCPLYVHQLRKVKHSPFVPKGVEPAPVPDWKRIDLL